jgi:hypothetical protein
MVLGAVGNGAAKIGVVECGTGVSLHFLEILLLYLESFFV